MKQVKRHFVDIPVGDYMAPSHVAEHPSLHVYGAAKVHSPQTHYHNLCTSKSLLASAFHALNFKE
jgi:hypothetical protein